MGRFSRLGNALYTGRRSIDFVGRTKVWYALSGVIILLAIGGLWLRGLNMGIEFTGGAEFRATLSTQVTQAEADDLRVAVAETGIDAASAPIVTTSGENSILVQTEPLSTDEADQVAAAIVAQTGVAADDLSRSEIGASWGAEVAKRSVIGLVVFLILVVLFIWAYFREWKMSVAAIVALIHDVLITIGVYALSGFEVTPATVTGVLTILGFSLYDTVVVFDKVRENTHDLRAARTTYRAAANLAVNQTLVRSINTSIVALIPVGAILYVGAVQLGASTLKDLALALFVGMAAGAYSSIFIATPLLVQLKSGEADVQQAEKRAAARSKRVVADRYAAVPAVRDERDTVALGEVPEHPDELREDAPAPSVEPRRPADGPVGRGRALPQQKGGTDAGASGRPQPARRPRSKRGK